MEKLSGNEKLANQGVADQAKGAAKETWGNAKDAAKEVHQSHKDAATDKAHETRDANPETASVADALVVAPDWRASRKLRQLRFGG